MPGTKYNVYTCLTSCREAALPTSLAVAGWHCSPPARGAGPSAAAAWGAQDPATLASYSRASSLSPLCLGDFLNELA